MEYEVILKWHQDDGTGQWGVCHVDSVGTFNAFWSPDGIFHDVFEHYFEDKHPYFSGKYAHTIYGEMAASGHAIAYRDIGIDNFKFRGAHAHRNFTADTTHILMDWLYGYAKSPEYPVDKELCRVPQQAYIRNSYNLNTWINEYLGFYDNHIKDGRTIIRQIRKSDIVDCYRWGYKRGLKLVKDREHSYGVMNNFLEQWYRITFSISTALCRELYIDDEFAYPVRAFKFKVKTSPKLQVEQIIIDEARNEYPIEALITDF